ncbi:MAG: glycosyltransferase [Bacteroidota bacterium]
MLKFVRYLASAGWDPAVLTVSNGSFPDHDATLLYEVPPHLPVRYAPALDPLRWYARLTGHSTQRAPALGAAPPASAGLTARLAAWIRANVFIPDARVGWVPGATQAALRWVQDEAFDALLTTGPPHSAHLIGAMVQRRTGVPWVADFRDPWTDIGYYQDLPHTPWARRLDAALEALVLRRADRVVTVSPSWQRLLADKSPPGRSPVHLIRNGYDRSDLAAGGPVAPADEDFVLTHVGSLYATRNPSALWQALAQMRTTHPAMRLRVRLVGRVDTQVLESARAHGLSEMLDVVGYVPHAEAAQWMQQATALLLLIEPFEAAGGMIPGKAYEYIATGRPVVGLGPVGGDADALLRDVAAGPFLALDDVAGLTATLTAWYEHWAAGTPPTGATSDVAATYSRQHQARQLGALLDTLLPSSTEAA